MSVRAFAIVMAVLAALGAGVAVMHHPGAMRSLHFLAGGMHGAR